MYRGDNVASSRRLLLVSGTCRWREAVFFLPRGGAVLRGYVVRSYGGALMVRILVQLLESATLSSHAACLYGVIASYLSIECTNPSHRRLAMTWESAR